jgi:hypothetical protein
MRYGDPVSISNISVKPNQKFEQDAILIFVPVFLYSPPWKREMLKWHNKDVEARDTLLLKLNHPANFWRPASKKSAQRPHNFTISNTRPAQTAAGDTCCITLYLCKKNV